MDIVLVAGLWLDATAWDAVVPELRRAGHRALPVALPGQGDGNAAATLDDQVAAVVAAVDGAEGRPLVVGHSAACTLAWLAADARPEQVAATALVGGWPTPDGEKYAAFFDIADGACPSRAGSPSRGRTPPTSTQATRDRVAAAAIPVPEAVAHGVVRLTDPRRYDVPTVLVCPEFTPGRGAGVDRRGQPPRAGQGHPSRDGRPRLGPLADVQPARRAGAGAGRGRRPVQLSAPEVS